MFCPFANMRDILIYSVQNNAAIFFYCKSDLAAGTTNLNYHLNNRQIVELLETDHFKAFIAS